MSPLRTASVFNEISSDEVLLICFCILKRDLRIVHLFKVVFSIRRLPTQFLIQLLFIAHI